MSGTEIRCFRRPYDWDSIDMVVHDAGGVIAEKFFTTGEVADLNGQIDGYLQMNPEVGLPDSGSSGYDRFLGHRTVRLHALIEKFPSAADWIGHPELFAWGERSLEPVATSVLLNAAELIQIGPGEPAQYLHRDTDSWPMAPLGEHPLMVNALVALDAFTIENGATRFVPGSWSWPRERRAQTSEMLRATMAPGDALLFRGDVVHGGGANGTEGPRRAVSISYCAGWLRPVENSILNVSKQRARALEPQVRQLLGFAAYDGSRDRGGLVGLYQNGDPGLWLEE